MTLRSAFLLSSLASVGFDALLSRLTGGRERRISKRDAEAAIEGAKRAEELKKYAVYTRQQRRRAEFELAFQEITAKYLEPRATRRKIARSLAANRRWAQVVAA